MNKGDEGVWERRKKTTYYRRRKSKQQDVGSITARIFNAERYFDIISKMKKKMIFDCDGVLVDTEVQWKKMWLEFLPAVGYDFKEEDYSKFPGGNWPIFYRELCRLFPDFFSTYQEMLDSYHRYFADYKIDYRGLAMAQVTETVKELNHRGYQLVIASSSPYEHIEQVARALEIEQYFDFYVSGYDFKQSKPDPEIYLYSCKKLGEIPQDCWVVEDSTYGIAAAKAAGTRVIALKDQRFGYDQSLADYRVDNLGEILNIVR